MGFEDESHSLLFFGGLYLASLNSGWICAVSTRSTFNLSFWSWWSMDFRFSAAAAASKKDWGPELRVFKKDFFFSAEYIAVVLKKKGNLCLWDLCVPLSSCIVSCQNFIFSCAWFLEMGLAKLLIPILSLPSLNLFPFYLLSWVLMGLVASVCSGMWASCCHQLLAHPLS